MVPGSRNGLYLWRLCSGAVLVSIPPPPSPLPSSDKLFVSVWHLRQILSDSIRFRTHPFHRRRLGPVRQFHPTLILEGSTFTKLVQSLNYVIAFTDEGKQADSWNNFLCFQQTNKITKQNQNKPVIFCLQPQLVKCKVVLGKIYHLNHLIFHQSNNSAGSCVKPAYGEKDTSCLQCYE